MRTLLASAERTESGVAAITDPTIVRLASLAEAASFVLRVAAVGTDGTDTLDVYLQRLAAPAVDETLVATWDDVVHWTQVAGDDTAPVQFVATWTAAVAPSSALHAPQDAALAAGVAQGGRLGSSLRVKWVIVDGNDAAFTFQVDGEIWR